MNPALLITHPSHDPIQLQEGWLSFYNSREYPLEARSGILNVKKVFSLKKPLKKATVISTALGVYRLFVNGQRVFTPGQDGPLYDELKPGWTDYNHRLLSYEYEITNQLAARNVILAEVGSGWWSGHISYGTYGLKRTAFAAQITLEYQDGTAETIVTDESWDAMVGGPTRTADIWNGQYYDASLPHPAREPDYYQWDKAVFCEEYPGRIEPNTAEPVRVRRHLEQRPQTALVYEGALEDGTDFGQVKVLSRSFGHGCEAVTLRRGQSLVIDFGQEMVGWPRLTVQGAPGTELEVFFGEMLNDSGLKSRGNDGPRGSVYLANYRSALSRYVVKLAGEGPQVYTPYFTFYGFRYLEIRATGDIAIDQVTGQVLGSDLTETGTFHCDNQEVNRLFSNVLWGMRGNYLSVPTDCPQRNERLGWTGDTQIFCGAASYLADIRGFMHKWLADCRASQLGHKGAYADVVPRSIILGDGGNGAWGDAGIIIPYRLYLMYNDKEVLREHYDSMVWYMEFLEGNGLKGPGTAFGDWLNYAETSKEYVSVCYYAWDLQLMEKISRILDRDAQADYYETRRNQVIGYWRETYVLGGQLTEDTQTAYLLPLAFDMVPRELAAPFQARLRQLIEDNDYTLTTGFVGTGNLCQTLDSLGMTDLCYSLLLQTRDPSWLYSVRQGATTIWERWNSYTLERGFGDVDMNSFNHYSYGAVAQWFFEGICGIRPDENSPGFSHFFLKPNPDNRSVIPQGQQRIRSAKASYESIAGRIESGWALVNGAWEYDFVIPQGAWATVSILRGSSLSFSGMEVSPEALGARCSGDRLEFSLGPGSYHIRCGA